MTEDEITFLYLALAKVLNALDEAGEAVNTYDLSRVQGCSDSVRWDRESETWRRVGRGR